MKMKTAALPAALTLIFLLASCGMSKAGIESRVAAEFQQSLDGDDDLSGYGMEVKSVSLVKTGSNAYDGYVTVALDGESHNIGITVTTDADDILLETDPFAFSFLAEKALENLFDW
ncbi:MAG: hypothetical protein LBO80_11320 [Treponema sp.]|jgi:hypothetical protein|nr:hypothetical protein [Treponema sp.]